MQFQPKYAELQSKSWLEQKYIEEQLSSTIISKIVGCHKDSVVIALRRNNIPIRTNKAARKLVPLQSFKYDVLNDRKWLYQKYVVEELSTEDITELIGAKTCNSVRQALIRHNMPVRTVSDGLTIGREEDGFCLNAYSQQLIEGGLLGDATMHAYNRRSDYSYPIFKRKNKFYDHVLYVISEIGMQDCRIRKQIQTLNHKKYQMFSCSTLTHKYLLPLFRKWYPAENNYVKVVPNDLVLTPTILLHWFLDDGTSSWRNRKYPNGWKQRKKPVRLTFCSESFTKEENQFLCEQIKDLFDVSCSVTPVRGGTGWRIKVLQSSVSAFFEIIGPCPVPSLAYKWKIP